MTATNHALTGALLALAIKQPAVALPLAFMSHFVLDALPHFGIPDAQDRLQDSVKVLFFRIWRIDAVTLFGLLALLALGLASPWPLIAAVVAISPDFAWVYRYTIKEKWGRLEPGPTNWFNSFHSMIQKREFRRGWLIEIIWFVTMGSILLHAI